MAFDADDFHAAHEICLDALEALGKTEIDEFSGLAAMLTVTMHAAYSMAPSQSVADELIAFARGMAQRNADQERGLAAAPEEAK
jgi:hypothetical protein